MPGYWCHYCGQPRSNCIPDHGPGTCSGVERAAREKREEDALLGKRVAFGSMPGGTTDLARKMDQTRNFHKDMYAYESAVKAGENPDGTTRKAIETTRKRLESFERVERKGLIERTA